MIILIKDLYTIDYPGDSTTVIWKHK